MPGQGDADDFSSCRVRLPYRSFRLPFISASCPAGLIVFPAMASYDAPRSDLPSPVLDSVIPSPLSMKPFACEPHYISPGLTICPCPGPYHVPICSLILAFHDPSLHPYTAFFLQRNANLNENAAFQSEIINIVYSAIVI